MYFWNSYPFVRLSFALIVGIVLFDHQPTLWLHTTPVLGCLLACIAISLLLAHRLGYYQLRHLTGFLSLTCVVYLGGLLTQLHYHSPSEDHYTTLEGSIKGFSGVISSPVNERTNHYRYDVELTGVSGDTVAKTSGTIHLYIRKDSSSYPSLKYGDHLLIYGRFFPIQGPGNPAEFDYRTYLARQNIYAHSFVEMKDIQIVAYRPTSRLLSWAYDLREEASYSMLRNIPSARENAVMRALVIGIKDHLDNDLKKSYSSAGAMHVLAVSGLHVGIIYLLIQLLLGKLKNFGRKGRILFGLTSISLIWLYAIMTGLSPSVLRAATMFSMIALGQSNAREGNIYNTLGLAAFLLLCFNPYLIYSVGFQLSFIAVIGIVYLHPKLYRLLSFRWHLLDRIWGITCVSIAAQLATFPLSAYYFHQFPTYFLVSNLVVIPAAFLLLIGGILLLLTDLLFPSIAKLLGFIIEKFLWLVNESIFYIESLPNSLVEWIFIDKYGLVLIYLILLTTIAGLHFRYFKTLCFSFVLGIALLCWNVTDSRNQSAEEKLVFYDIADKTVIDYIRGHDSKLYVSSYDSSELSLLGFQINPNRLSSHLRPIKTSINDISTRLSNQGAIRYGEIGTMKIFVFDSTTYHLDFKSPIESDILLIEHESVKSLEWLMDHFRFKHLIIGNQNRSFYIKRLRFQAVDLDIKIHSLKEDGAFILDIKKERTMQPALFTTNPD